MFEEILEKIRPKHQEKQKNVEISERLIREINKRGHKAVMVGSRARDTFLSGDRDLDIFVFFSPDTPREELEKKGIWLGKEVLRKYNPKIHYAEHPYVKGTVEGLTVEIVPCYRIKDKIISAVDRSPLHNEFVIKNLREDQKDSVLLLKQFLKVMNCYGADQKARGFSGYLCELLIINYGSLENLMRAAANWDKKTVINIAKYKIEEKFEEPLVVIDPVDANRNVAAAVSRTTLSKFILHAREFVKNPSPKFFVKEEKKIDIKKEVQGRNIVILKFGCPAVIEEILWSQLERLKEGIKKQFVQNDFIVMNAMHWTDEKKTCAIVFELAAYDLSIYCRHRGPEVWDKENCEKFIEKNPDYFVSRSRLFSWRKREYKNAGKLINSFLKKSEQIPSHLRGVIEKYKIIMGKKVVHEKEILYQYFNN